ncbi:TIGR03619 family F420-dependent LLM class oxidoreductase [Amycolatopsis albispora]|uniref:LLM class F420-dependent oxidoreductase n=1 Tax=Amycolatopsis albispora TaxID=1804986 RepID=A0A344LFD4_9PSEU|nr:TIGR03619 family F420-dependent LLM class oxidoreductase [Amycolatopsis albispora]AXB46758.1 LLM class F420-dependent oxidoreductase [Amycolatopsis albispora]
MRLGVGLPHYGALADPAGIATFAAHAEKVGYESLWVGDRVLTPLEPSDLYPGGTPERPYPPQFTRYFDPLVALTVAATATERIRLGSSTLIGTLHSPVLLARTLTSIDLLSRGRLDVGLGIGWMRSEYAAAGVPWSARGRRLEELMDALVAMWTGDPVAHEGPLWQIPPSQVDLRPVQRPHPPLLLGAHTEAALERVGRKADGWLPAGRPLEVMAQQWDVIRAAADRAGRDPDRLRRVLRLNPRPGAVLTDVAAQLSAAREAGIEEAFVDLHFIASDVGEATELADELFALVGQA